MSNAYESLVAKLDFPGSQRLITVMEYIMTPEEAVIADLLPGSPEEVAQKSDISPEKAKAILDDLFFRGIVFARGDMEQRTSYRFARGIIQIHDATAQGRGAADHQEFYKIWNDFYVQEWYPYIAKNADAFLVGRVVPAYNAIKDLPDVQPWENYRELLKAQDIAAVVPCCCRLEKKAVGDPCSHSDDEEVSKCLQFNKGAEYVLLRGNGNKLTPEEVIAVADQAEDDGLVHIWGIDRKMQANTSCQCCDDCCLFFETAHRHNVSIEKIYAKSRFAATLDQDKCSGCQNCVERCNFNAIDMVRQGKKYKAALDQEKCWGCGVCTLKCEPGALQMEAIRPIDFVPEVTKG
ncbi:MAG: 4Fe-4S binding protein [Bacillota bacterium]